VTSVPSEILRRACTAPESFARQAARTPRADAVVCGNAAISYAELDVRANALGAHLRRLGVGRDVVVGLCMERSIAAVAGALGIMMAGGAYLPIDPAHPKERLAFQLADAGAGVVVAAAGA
jgi:non-ribosomal peptide synthetase component F